jgi:hypothetical protein
VKYQPVTLPRNRLGPTVWPAVAEVGFTSLKENSGIGSLVGRLVDIGWHDEPNNPRATVTTKRARTVMSLFGSGAQESPVQS